MHQASALLAGATRAAARAIWPGPARYAAGIVGGMHHAMAAHARGFEVYNDVAVAIAWLLRHGAERIAYVDIDAHHGDRMQAAFYADPRVLTISLHQHPADVLPFTDLPAETGGRGAEGSAVNVALPARTGNADWHTDTRPVASLRRAADRHDRTRAHDRGAPAVFVPFKSGYDLGDPVDRETMATRNAVFPWHGLMP
jgi:acetoin utilization deacetylase AcuC-like enzyme